MEMLPNCSAVNMVEFKVLGFGSWSKEKVVGGENRALTSAGGIWKKITGGMAKVYGEPLVRAWFGEDKLEASIDEEGKTIKLKALMSIVKQRIEQDYIDEVRDIASGFGYQLEGIC